MSSVKLICLPWAGGSSRLYAPWASHPLSTAMELVTLELPGRMSRAAEKAVTRLPGLAAQLVEECVSAGLLDGTFALLGYSFGAAVVFEMATLLETKGKLPLAVCVCALRPPHMPLASKHLSHLDSEQILHYFASKGNPIASEITSNHEAQELFLSAVRADYECLETYEPSDAVLSCPLIVSGGTSDEGVPVDLLEEWRAHSSASTSVKTFNGGHYFFLHLSAELADHILSVLSPLAAKAERAAGQMYEAAIAAAFVKVLGLPEDIVLNESSNFFEVGSVEAHTLRPDVYALP